MELGKLIFETKLIQLAKAVVVDTSCSGIDAKRA